MRMGADQTDFAKASFAGSFQPLNLISTIKQAFDLSSTVSTASNTCIASNCKVPAAMQRNKQNTEK